jgi:hypothetical protein
MSSTHSKSEAAHGRSMRRAHFSSPPYVANDERTSTDTDLLEELRMQLRYRDVTIQELKLVVRHLESKDPNVQQIVRSRLEMERKVYNEKSEKVCFTHLISIHLVTSISHDP